MRKYVLDKKVHKILKHNDFLRRKYRKLAQIELSYKRKWLEGKNRGS